MLDSERTFKITITFALDSFQSFVYVSNYLHLKSFTWKRDCPISLTTNITTLAKVIQESPYTVLQVTSKQKTLKQSVYFLKAVEFCPTFDTQIDITLANFGRGCKTTLFRKPTEVSQNTPTSYQQGQPLRNNGLLKIRKIFC